MRCTCAQVSKGPAADQSVEVAELRRQIGSIDADITLVNERLCALLSLLCCIGKYERGIILMRHVWTADGVAAMEAPRVELAQAKEQAWASNAAALKAAEERKR